MNINGWKSYYFFHLPCIVDGEQGDIHLFGKVWVYYKSEMRSVYEKYVSDTPRRPQTWAEWRYFLELYPVPERELTRKPKQAELPGLERAA